MHHLQEYDVGQRRTRGVFNFTAILSSFENPLLLFAETGGEKVAQLHRVCLERVCRCWEAGVASENGRWVILESHKEGVIGNLRCSNNNKRDFYGTFPRSRGTLHKIIEQL